MYIRSLILACVAAAGLSTAAMAAEIGNSPPGFFGIDALGSPPMDAILMGENDLDLLLLDDAGPVGFHVIEIADAGALDPYDPLLPLAIDKSWLADDDPALFSRKVTYPVGWNLAALIDDGGGGELCAASATSLHLGLSPAWNGFDTADPAAALSCPAIASMTAAT